MRWLVANVNANIDQSTLARYEEAGRHPPPSVLWGLAALYKRPLTDLVRLYLPDSVKATPAKTATEGLEPGSMEMEVVGLLRSLPPKQRDNVLNLLRDLGEHSRPFRGKRQRPAS